MIGSLKRFKIISDRYRNRRKRFGLRFNLIAGIANNDQKFFTLQLAITNALISTGFVGAGVLGGMISRNSKNVIFLVYLASILAIGACVVLITSVFFLPLLYLSACMLGIGTYCF